MRLSPPTQHTQALMYPLLVATKSQSSGRRTAAFSVLDCIRQHSPSLVEQAHLVSHELIRMAILWHEMWHEVRPCGPYWQFTWIGVLVFVL